MEPDDLLCSRNAPGLVCLVGWSFWFFWMNFRSDQPDRRDRPYEPAFIGRAQWKINQLPSLERERASELGGIICNIARRAQLDHYVCHSQRGEASKLERITSEG